MVTCHSPKTHMTSSDGPGTSSAGAVSLAKEKNPPVTSGHLSVSSAVHSRALVAQKVLYNHAAWN
jgi:hypothetical protein